jgi:hypothetical protein
MKEPFKIGKVLVCNEAIVEKMTLQLRQRTLDDSVKMHDIPNVQDVILAKGTYRVYKDDRGRPRKIYFEEIDTERATEMTEMLFDCRVSPKIGSDHLFWKDGDYNRNAKRAERKKAAPEPEKAPPTE